MRAAVLALSLLFAGPADLKPLTVKSGEIAGFKRDHKPRLLTSPKALLRFYEEKEATYEQHLAELKENGFAGAVAAHLVGPDEDEVQSFALGFADAAGVKAEKKRQLALFSTDLKHHAKYKRISVPAGGTGYAATTKHDNGNIAYAVIPNGTCLLTVGVFIQNDTDVAALRTPVVAGVKAVLARTSRCS
jgi:hypothetical protein